MFIYHIKKKYRVQFFLIGVSNYILSYCYKASISSNLL